MDDMENGNRDNWTFEYTGRELLSAALEKMEEYTDKENKARKNCAKETAETCRQIKEKCFIWAYEFCRKPDKQYNLSLDDVNFFELATPTDENSLIDNTFSMSISCRYENYWVGNHLTDFIREQLAPQKVVRRIKR